MADRIASDGPMPLEVIIEAMRSAYIAGDLKDAAAFAEKAAPYLHPRLSSVSATATVDADIGICVRFE